MAKILVVDDSETVRSQLKKDLETKGHEVIEAGDGVQGLESVRSAGRFDLILCDVNMPNMDGLTMCAKIHEQSEHSGTPIFMLTTESNADMKAKGKEAGVRAWITKPYVANALLSAVEKITKR